MVGPLSTRLLAAWSQLSILLGRAWQTASDLSADRLGQEFVMDRLEYVDCHCHTQYVGL